jgi:hypothetical protein
VSAASDYSTQQAECEYCTRLTYYRNLDGEAVCAPNRGCSRKRHAFEPPTTRKRVQPTPKIPPGPEYDGLRAIWRKHSAQGCILCGRSTRWRNGIGDPECMTGSECHGTPVQPDREAVW